jgi:hypothetical protein
MTWNQSQISRIWLDWFPFSVLKSWGLELGIMIKFYILSQTECAIFLCFFFCCCFLLLFFVFVVVFFVFQSDAFNLSRLYLASSANFLWRFVLKLYVSNYFFLISVTTMPILDLISLLSAETCLWYYNLRVLRMSIHY